jgi:hypothetical protein
MASNRSCRFLQGLGASNVHAEKIPVYKKCGALGREPLSFGTEREIKALRGLWSSRTGGGDKNDFLPIISQGNQPVKSYVTSGILVAAIYHILIGNSEVYGHA